MFISCFIKWFIYCKPPLFRGRKTSRNWQSLINCREYYLPQKCSSMSLEYQFLDNQNLMAKISRREPDYRGKSRNKELHNYRHMLFICVLALYFTIFGCNYLYYLVKNRLNRGLMKIYNTYVLQLTCDLTTNKNTVFNLQERY